MCISNIFGYPVKTFANTLSIMRCSSILLSDISIENLLVIWSLLEVRIYPCRIPQGMNTVGFTLILKINSL